MRSVALVATATAAIGLAACGSASSPTEGKLDVVATTTQLADFARQVGGDDVRVTQVLRPNTDPHDYEPRPDDVRRTATADVVLTSGDGLDRWMTDVVEQSGSKAKVVDVGARVPVRLPGETDGDEASPTDPHWWHDPRNAQAAVTTIAAAMRAAAPDDAAAFSARADAYLARLRSLDTTIADCLTAIPRAARKIVTDHDAFGYFARRYGIDVVGAVIPSQTTQSQASAGDVAELVRTIRREHAKAVFPETSVNRKLATAIARASGATVGDELYGDTLGPADSAGATYIGMEQSNATAILRGMTGDRTARCAAAPAN